MNEDLCDYQLLHEKPIPQFGTLLKQVCLRVGITQPLLEKYGQAEYLRMVQEGKFNPNDAPPSSMLQQVISMVILGKQRPSYPQTVIWIKVIKAHYNNTQVKKYFEEQKGLEMPIFTKTIEEALWILSGHQPPESVKNAIEAFEAFDYVPHRLPRGMEIAPQTDTGIGAVRREEPQTGPIIIPIRELED